ncbi:MAG: hypothetical protein ACRDVP_00230 [Acidimicrobiales bacterium]
MTGREEAPAHLHLAAAGRLTGSYCAVERALFELTGAIAASEDLESRASVLLDSWSTEHAWHAELWAERLPQVAEIDPSSLVVLDEPVAGLLAKIATQAPPLALVGLVRVVLPRLIVSYRTHMVEASPVAQRPNLRALKLILSDEMEEWASGEALVQRLLSHAVEDPQLLAVTELQGALGENLAHEGLLPWPGRRA